MSGSGSNELSLNPPLPIACTAVCMDVGLHTGHGILKKQRLAWQNRDKKIGPENTFYTLLTWQIFLFPADSTRTLPDPVKESAQKYYDDHAGKAFIV